MIERALRVCSSGLIKGYSSPVSWLRCAVENTTRSQVLSVSGRKRLSDVRVTEPQEDTKNTKREKCPGLLQAFSGPNFCY